MPQSKGKRVPGGNRDRLRIPCGKEYNMRKRRLLILVCLVVALLGVYAVACLIWRPLESIDAWEYRCCPIPLSTTFVDHDAMVVTGERITVKQKLKEIGAECRSGQLYDRQGRPIYLYVRSTAENLSPAGKEERKEIAKLSEQYNVVVITEPIPHP